VKISDFPLVGKLAKVKCESRSPLDSTDCTSGPWQGRWVQKGCR